MNTFQFGYSATGQTLLAYEFKSSHSNAPHILVLGGVHGDESEGIVAAAGLLTGIMKNPLDKIHLTLIPIFNPDGAFTQNRLNGNGVDLNRNLPTQDWNPESFNDRYPPGPSAGSEPESRAIIDFLKKNPQDLIISLHSWKPLLNTNGACQDFAKKIQAKTGYTIEESIGYPTPGCLGTYAGLERKMPTLTYEIERGQKPKDILSIHVPALYSALKEWAQEREISS